MLRNTLDLNDRILARQDALKTRSCRLRIWQKVDVRLVHGSKILHVCQIDVVFDDLLERRARQLEYFLQVLQCFSLKRGTVSGLTLLGRSDAWGCLPLPA